MSETGKKWVLWIASTIFLLSFLTMLVSSTPNNDLIDTIIPILSPLLLITGSTMIIMITIRYREQKWFLIIANISTYLLPLFIFIIDRLINYSGSIVINLFFITIICAFILLAGINIFILGEAVETKSIFILLSLIAISFVIQRFSTLQDDIVDFSFTFFLLITLLTGSGMLLYGLRCLLQIKKNLYLKYISLIACFVIAYGSFVFASKMTGEGVPVLELVYFVPAFLLTLIVLFSLPFSGYIHWITLHKRILKKIMIPWIFFFIVFSVSIVSPDLIRKIISREDNKTIEFQMNDYEVKNKNGLEPV